MIIPLPRAYSAVTFELSLVHTETDTLADYIAVFIVKLLAAIVAPDKHRGIFAILGQCCGIGVEQVGCLQAPVECLATVLVGLTYSVLPLPIMAA